MIGIFDSGLGGLTVWRSLRERLPRADIAYLADQAHVPYGDRTEENLRALLAANLSFFERPDIELIVAGCNTSCAIARRYGWPRTSVPIVDVIESGASAAVATGAQRIGVIATAATARMGAYGNAIRALAPHIVVEEVAAPALVPLIEGGRLAGPEISEAIGRAIAEFSALPQTLVYGCTHYPLADDAFAALLGAGVARIDPAQAQVQRVLDHFGAAEPSSNGRTLFRTTGDPVLFREQIFALAGPYRDVERVELEGLAL